MKGTQLGQGWAQVIQLLLQLETSFRNTNLIPALLNSPHCRLIHSPCMPAQPQPYFLRSGHAGLLSFLIHSAPSFHWALLTLLPPPGTLLSSVLVYIQLLASGHFLTRLNPSCYRLNVCAPLQIHTLKSNPHYDGIWRWGLWAAICALMRGIPESSLALL